MMDSLSWIPGDLSRLTSLSRKTSSLIIGTSTNQNDIMMRTNNKNALYINESQNILLQTSHTRGRLNIGDLENHIVCYYDNDMNKYSTLSVDSTGSLRLSSIGDVYIDKPLYLLGQRLNASASELNYVSGVVPGVVSESKALVTNASKGIEGLSEISALNIIGTLRTSNQPFITEVGTLISLSVQNGITASLVSASSYVGTLLTSDQPNITSVGTLGSLNVSNNISASTLTGTLQTSNQPNITSVGTLSSLSVQNGITANSLSVTSLLISDLNVSNSITTSTLTASVPIATSSGGTGSNTYSKGELLVGNSTNGLSKVPLSTNNNDLLFVNSSTSTGVSYGYGYIPNTYTMLINVITNSPTSYSIGSFFGQNSTNQTAIIIPTTNAINLLNFGLNALAISPTQTGTVYPNSTSSTVTGLNTLFNSSVVSPHTVVTLGEESRRVVSVTNNTTFVVDRPFTILNLWSLGATGTIGGNARFGTNAFNGANAVTSFTNIQIGSRHINYTTDASKRWTLEFWVRFTNLNAAQSFAASTTANTFQLSLAAITGNMSISLGQGTTFNIANAAGIGAAAAATYVHIAVVFTGTSYVVYRNGAVALTVNTTLSLTQTCFNNFRFGSNGTVAFNGQIDEVRLSSIARYTQVFAAPTAAFVYDSSTLALNHFNNTTSVTNSDDATADIPDNRFTYVLDGGLAVNTVYYGYAITNDTNTGYTFSSSFTQPPLPNGFTLFRQLPFSIVTNGTGTLIASRYTNDGASSLTQLLNPVPIIAIATTSTILNTSLFPFVPQNTKSIILLITHTHLTATSCSVAIGHSSFGLTNLLTTNTPSTIQLQYTLPIVTMSIDTLLTAAGTGSSYSISLCGYYV